VGVVTADTCEHWRGLLALEAVGALPAEDRAPLDAHVRGCAACEHERDELAQVAMVLPMADPDHFHEHRMPGHLEDTVLTRLAADARQDRRRRGIWVCGGVLGGAAAVLAALALAMGLSSSGSPGRTLVLHGPAGVSASVRLTSESWGTAVHLSERGQPGGQVLWVWMRTTAGSWWATGTYTTVSGQTVAVDMACALPAGRIAGVWVRDASGHTVLQGYQGDA